MSSARCLFVGGAEPVYYGDSVVEQARKRRLIASVQQDFLEMTTFVSKTSSVIRRPGAAVQQQFRHPVAVSKMLVNEHISSSLYDGLRRSLRQGSKEFANLQGAKQLSYARKEQVRHEIRQFLQQSRYQVEQNLILFMAGHGKQQKPYGQTNEESFILPKATHGEFDEYTDTELTEDINDALPPDKRLYIIIHACHSGGMLNLWQLNTENKWFALFASAEADILADWSHDESESTFIQAFCNYAQQGKMLGTIAGDIVRNCANVSTGIRPAFITSNPDIALQPFL